MYACMYVCMYIYMYVSVPNLLIQQTNPLHPLYFVGGVSLQLVECCLSIFCSFTFLVGSGGGQGTSSEQLECDLSRRLVERFEVTEN